MGKKRKSKKQKQLINQRRKQHVNTELSTSDTLNNQIEKSKDFSQPIILKSPNIPHRQEPSIYPYPIGLIKKDLLKSIFLAIFALGILFFLRQYLG